jgi:hypothetical protein
MKPVCWIRQDGVIAFHEQKEVDSQGYKWNPLYTLRELSDEEITEEWVKFYPDVFHTHLIQFARAILKCASGKTT